MDHEKMLQHAASLATDAQHGIYRIDGQRVEPETVACVLAEYLDRIAPAFQPHGWAGNREGVYFGPVPSVSDS